MILYAVITISQQLTNSEIKTRNFAFSLAVLFVFAQEKYSINQCGQRLMLNFGFAPSFGSAVYIPLKLHTNLVSYWYRTLRRTQSNISLDWFAILGLF